MRQETATERWARWHATRATQPADQTRRSHKIADQRRRAQQASVRARRHNASLRRQHEREDERRQETILQAILGGHFVPPKPLTEEQRKQLDNEWRRYMRSQRHDKIYRAPSGMLTRLGLYDTGFPTVDPFTLPLFMNVGDLKTVRQVLGRDPLWVRARTGERQSNAHFTGPPRVLKSWWKQGRLALAIRVEYSRYVGAEDCDYLYHVQVYYLWPKDLLTQIEGTYVPGEAVPWESVLATASDRVDADVPTMSISQVVRSIRSSLRLKAADRHLRPWSSRQRKVPPAHSVTTVEASPAQTKGQREEVQNGRTDVASIWGSSRSTW